MVSSVRRLIKPSWVMISFMARHLMPSWLKLIICECLLRSCSMPRDLVVQDNLSTLFVDLDDGITPTQLGFNMSQLAGNFRFDWITPFEKLI